MRSTSSRVSTPRRRPTAPPCSELVALPPSFYAGSVLEVARALIGTLLVRESEAGRVVARIVETEAYRGPEDRAAHSFGGRRTARNEVMWGEAGRAYVFFVYGMHWQLNLVTGEPGVPHAVLVRAVEPIEGAELMAQRRGRAPTELELCNGPGKLCVALDVDRRFDGADLRVPGPLWLAAPLPGPRAKVARSPRIGIDYAGAWADKPWRFYDAASRWVSRPPRRRAPI